MDASPYRETPPTSPDPYLAVWAQHRRSTRINAGVILGYFVGAVGATILRLGVWVGVPFVLSAALGSFYFGWFRAPQCPRCRKGFREGKFIRYPWAVKCMNCGLPFGIAKRDVRSERDS